MKQTTPRRDSSIRRVFAGAGILAVAGCLLLAAGPVDDPPKNDPAKDDGWKPLFNGKDLDGWVYKEKGSEL
ncbi:MAG: hypothetical protein CMJ67_07000, partial [Planctomycetaceae bacterium]|nr:hypothetical protein [Planctomycetaceae bacterium]